MKKLILIPFVFILFFNDTQLTAQDIGIQLYSLRNQFKDDVPGTLEIIKSWGITKVEGGETYGLPVEEFKKLLRKNNIEVVGVGAGFETLKNDPEAVIATAKSYGAAYAVCFWIPHNNKFTEADAKNALEVFNRAGAILKKEGLDLLYHPHGYEFRSYKDKTLMDYMITEATDFNFEMDVFWIKQGGEDPLALLKKYPGKFKAMHLKDRMRGTKGSQDGKADVETNVILGTGDVGIGDLVKEARKLGIQYLHIEDESSRVLTQVPKSLSFLKSIEE